MSTGAGATPDGRSPGDPESLAERFLALLRARHGSRLRYATPPTRLGGGYWATILAVRFDDAPPELSGELVLRVMPDTDRARREIVVQPTIASLGFPTPRVRLAGDAASELGSPFLLMERAAGGSLAGGLAGRELALAFRRMPRLLAEAMVALHRLDPTPLASALGRGGWPHDAVCLTAQLDELEASRALRFAGFAAALAWLRRRRPGDARLAVCHGDMQPMNLIVANGALSAVVDWTNALLADPTYDVAYTAQLLEQAPIRVPAALRPLRRWFGRRSARQFLAAHEAIAPIDRARLPWYDALHAFRLVLRVAEHRSGAAAAPLARSHPWEIAAEDARARVAAHTGVRVELPPRASD